MKATPLPMVRVLAAMLLTGVVSTARAQAPEACSLMTDTEVERVIGRTLAGEPQPSKLAAGAGSMCSYDDPTIVGIMVYSGPRADELWNDFLKLEGRDKEPRHPAAGDGAYLIYLRPQNEYQSAGAMVSLRVGGHRLGVFVAAEERAPAESVQSSVIALAGAVAAKLR